MNPYSATDIVRTLRSTYGLQENDNEFRAQPSNSRRWYSRIIRLGR